MHFQTHVHFTRHLFDLDNGILNRVLTPTGTQPPKLLVVLERDIASAFPALVRQIQAYCDHHDINLVSDPLILQGSEEIKQTDAGVRACLEAINAGDIDRHSYFMAIGGGAFLDATGLAAATAHRGVRSIRVPTTVMAMGDSGVGVKCAVNEFGKKNWRGAFHPPHAVLNDYAFLETLSSRDWIAGMSEAVKIGLIRDPGFIALLEADAPALVSRSMAAMGRLIHRSALGHMRHIREGGDPFEMGSARPLDHGHWSAHKLEAISNWEIRHGEAVAIGIALDAIYACRMGYLAAPDRDRILTLLTTLGFELWTPLLEARAADGQLLLVLGLEEFRQHLGGELTITLVQGIGQGFEVHEMDTAVIAQSLTELKQRFGLRQAA